jgi:transcriptional regulator with XRE-family HTH domain
MQNIGERIKKIIDYKSLNQVEFSELIGIPRSSLSEILNGKRCPSLEAIVDISNCFKEVNTEWLLKGEGSMIKNMLKEESPVYQSKSLGALESLVERVETLEQQFSEMKRKA